MKDSTRLLIESFAERRVYLPRGDRRALEARIWSAQWTRAKRQLHGSAYMRGYFVAAKALYHHLNNLTAPARAAPYN